MPSYQTILQLTHPQRNLFCYVICFVVWSENTVSTQQKSAITDDLPVAATNRLIVRVTVPFRRGMECNVAKNRARIYAALSFSGLCHFGVQCTKKYLITRCPFLLKYKGKARRYIRIQKWLATQNHLNFCVSHTSFNIFMHNI